MVRPEVPRTKKLLHRNETIRCESVPRGPQRQCTAESDMRMFLLLCFLSPWVGASSAQEIKRVNVPEGDDAPLPCILNSGQSIDKFDWRKDNGADEKPIVFEYDGGRYHGNGLSGQDRQFIDRVTFFQQELKSGNASIIIKDTRLEDSGVYTCGLADRNRPVHVTLNVVGDLKIRNVTGAARPYINQLRDESLWRLLECNVKGVPEPEVLWMNSAGETLAKYNPKSEERNTPIKLQWNVSGSDNYTCVATQRGISHQMKQTFEVRIPEVVAVAEGDDAVLCCSHNSKHDLESLQFSWEKDDKKVYVYNKGQVKIDDQLVQRLTDFKEELKTGNISIKIKNLRKSDSGVYKCVHSDSQKSSQIILQIIENNPDPNALTGWIVAGFLGAVLSILIVVLIIRYLYKRQRRKKSDHTSSLPLASQSK